MDTIGRYQIQGELGRGGMAVVYRAIDPNIGREVALKLLPRELSPDADFRARFQREVRTVGSLRNPAIVPLYDADEVNGQPYLVMALMSGGSLLERLKQGPIPLTETTLMINRLAPALDEAHSKGIIHRDLKPGNILLDETGAPYLSDFGIVKLVEATSMTSRGVVGTPAYMSPEHFRGQVTPQSDIYAMGVILFQMLTGRLPFQAQTPPEWMHAHIYETPPAIRAVNSHLPSAVEPVVNRTLAKEPGQRFGTAVELAQALTTAGRQGSEESPTVVATDQLWLTDPAGGRYPLRRGTITLGRSSQCDVVVNDHLASRQHATLEYDGQRCVVYDEGSANGTFINDQRVGSQGRPFQPGDRLRIGQTDYGLSHQAGEPVAGPPSPAVDTGAATGYGATRLSVGNRLPEESKEPLEIEDRFPLWGLVGGTIGVGVLLLLGLVVVAEFFSGRTDVALNVSPTVVGSQITTIAIEASTNTPISLPATNTLTPLPATNTSTPIPATNTSTPLQTPPTNTPTPLIPADMVRVPAGGFTMGSENGGSDEQPEHTVYVDEFYIDMYEVTNEQYRACVEAGDCEAPGCEDIYTDSDKGDHPVVCVSWQMARDYCEWAGKQLPTEAEWEKAARGRYGRVYPWGNEEPSCDRLQYSACDSQTVPVGNYETGKSPYGAYDMAGNVWEWTLSVYKDYPYDKNGNKNDNKNTSRVIRGGSWNDFANYARTAYRYNYDPDLRLNDLGFRCVQ